MFVKTLMFQHSGNVFECKVLEKRVLKKELAREHSKDREVLRFLSLHRIQTMIVWQVNILLPPISYIFNCIHQSYNRNPNWLRVRENLSITTDKFLCSAPLAAELRASADLKASTRMSQTPAVTKARRQSSSRAS